MYSKKVTGFTLLELMIAVAIIGILAALALPLYDNYVNRSRVLEAINHLDAMKKELQVYWSMHSTHPAKLSGVAVDDYDYLDGGNIRNRHYNYDSPTGKVWMSIGLSGQIIGEDVDDSNSRLTIHVGGIPVNGELVFLCGTWDELHADKIDLSWLPEGCNTPSIGEKLDDMLAAGD